MGGRSITGNSPRQRRSVSPQLTNIVSAKPPVERKGFTVRKTGMNNPLHQSQSPYAPSASVVPKSTPPVVPLVRKMIPPTTDDFFAEMGVASKPKFPAATSGKYSATKRLNATVLPLESDDEGLASAGGDNWGDDADLDDLLDS